MRYFIAAIAIVTVSSCAFADEHLFSSPETAKTTNDLTKAFGTTILFGQVEKAMFVQSGRQVFAVWYDPFSGRGACYLHVYYYDYDKDQWTRFINKLVDGSYALSAEMPVRGDVLIFRDADGKIVLKESIASVPRGKSGKTR